MRTWESEVIHSSGLSQIWRENSLRGQDQMDVPGVLLHLVETEVEFPSPEGMHESGTGTGIVVDADRLITQLALVGAGHALFPAVETYVKSRGLTFRVNPNSCQYSLTSDIGYVSSIGQFDFPWRVATPEFGRLVHIVTRHGIITGGIQRVVRSVFIIDAPTADGDSGALVINRKRGPVSFVGVIIGRLGRQSVAGVLPGANFVNVPLE